MEANTPLNPCKKCGAMTDCCSTSKARGAVAKSLSGIVDRQSAMLSTLTNEVRECRQVIAELRSKLKEVS